MENNREKHIDEKKEEQPESQKLELEETKTEGQTDEKRKEEPGK